MKFNEGDRVTLLANEDEGWITENATIEGVEDGYPDMYIVRVDRPAHLLDDRIREVHGGDMELINPKACQFVGGWCQIHDHDRGPEYGPGTVPGDSPGYGSPEAGSGHFGPGHPYLIRAARELIKVAGGYRAPFLPAELDRAIDGVRRALDSIDPEHEPEDEPLRTWAQCPIELGHARCPVISSGSRCQLCAVHPEDHAAYVSEGVLRWTRLPHLPAHARA